MKKKIIAILISLVLVLSLVACNDGSSSRETRDRRDRDRETTEETTEEPTETTVVETTETTARETEDDWDWDDDWDDDWDVWDWSDLFEPIDLSAYSSVGQRYVNALLGADYILMGDDSSYYYEELMESFYASSSDFTSGAAYLRARSQSDAQEAFDDIYEEFLLTAQWDDSFEVDTVTRGPIKHISIVTGAEGYMHLILDSDVIIMLIAEDQDTVNSLLNLLGY